MPRPISEQVIVITGSSSGIGRETAVRAARLGARVVVSARNEAALREVVEQIRGEGGEARAVVADVADFAQVRLLAEQAEALFGRIDTWVNNAAVAVYATVEQTTPEEFERITRVNYLGTVFGCKAALEAFGRQGGGTIINVASVESERAFPLHSAYSASKHAIKGFTEALRLEQRRNRTGVEVVQVNPAGINTPFFEHARSKVGALPMPAPPIYEPGLVADVILACAASPRRLAYAGGAAAMFSLLQRISPSLVDSILLTGDMGVRGQITDRPDNGVDNLDGPMDASIYRPRGLFGDQSKKDDWYTRAFEMHPTVGLAVLGGIALGALAVAAALSPPGRRAVDRGVREASRRAADLSRRATGGASPSGPLEGAGRAFRSAIGHLS